MLTFRHISKNKPDNWSKNGDIFTTEENLNKLKEKTGKFCFLIAEHWHFGGARAPTRFIIEDYDDFIAYLKENALAGDIIDIYDMTETWEKARSNKGFVISGKCPNELGEIPENGSY